MLNISKGSMLDKSIPPLCADVGVGVLALVGVPRGVVDEPSELEESTATISPSSLLIFGQV